MSRYRIGNSDIPYAREFMRNPRGNASPGLQRVLNRMRTDITHGKYVLVVVSEPCRRWVLGRMSGLRGAPVELLDYEFDDCLEAERTVFRLRWKQLTGEDLDL